MQYIPKFRQLLSLIGYIFGSWVLVHVMAVFGFFLSAAYPIWWLFFPHRVLCLFCRFGQIKGYCSVCRQPVDQEHLYPKSFVSAWVNTFFLAFLTIFFIGVVFIEGKVLSSFLPDQPTVYFSIPSKGQYVVGDSIEFAVELQDIRQPINVVQSDISFDPKMLRLESIDTKNSFASLFVQKEIENELGYARLVGGVPNPGFSGSFGTFATFIFTTLDQGVTEVTFLPSSLVLANNGKGTNLLREYSSTQYLVLPQVGDTQNPEVVDELPAPALDMSGVDSDTTQRLAQELSPKIELYDSFSVVLGSSVDSMTTTQAPVPQGSAVRKNSFFMSLIEKIHAFDKKVIALYRTTFGL